MNNNTEQTNEQQPHSAIWYSWNSARILALIIALQSAGFILQGIIYGTGLPMFPSVGLGTVLGILVPLFVLSRQPGLSLRRDFSIFPISFKTALLSAAIAVASLVPMSLLGSLSVRIKAPDPEWIQYMTDSLPNTTPELILALITVSIIAPLAEELIFRGLLYRLVKRTWGIPHAFAISALVFAIIHFQPWFILGLVGVGLLLAFVYETTGSVLAAAICHMVYNGFSLVQMTYQEEPFAIDAPIETSIILWAGVSVMMMVLIGRNLRQAAHHSAI